MARVWVLQETNHDFTKAETFGEVVFLSVAGRDDFNNVRGSLVNERLLAYLTHELRDFDPEEDFIVITGSPYITAAVFLILGNRRVQKIKFLRWDNRDLVYIPLYVELRKEMVT
jgi:hypothetical protein